MVARKKYYCEHSKQQVYCKVCRPIETTGQIFCSHNKQWYRCHIHVYTAKRHKLCTSGWNASWRCPIWMCTDTHQAYRAKLCTAGLCDFHVTAMTPSGWMIMWWNCLKIELTKDLIRKMDVKPIYMYRYR